MPLSGIRSQIRSLGQNLRRHKAWTAILIVVIALFAIRLALPFVLKDYINRTLNDIDGFSGHVETIHVALWRGTYEADGVAILKDEAKTEKPFFSADKVSVALDWRALIRGHLKTKITLYRPKLELIQEADPKQSQTSVDPEPWQEHLTKLYPFEINQFRIYDGFIQFENKTSNPKINFFADKLHLVADNIKNTAHSDKRLPSSVSLDGLFLRSGRLKAEAQFNMLTEPSEIDFKGTLRDLNLKEINDFARAYGKFDFEEGKMNVAAELAASKTNYSGYVKTALIAPKVVDWSKEKKEGKSTGNLIWQSVAGTIIDLFKNHNRNQFAAKIPLSGSRSSLHVNSWAAVGSIMKNAFIKALDPKLEDSVKFSDAIQSGSTQNGESGADSKRQQKDEKTAK